MNIKTKVRKFWELSIAELTEFKSWLKTSTYRCHVNNETYAAPSLCVGTTKDDKGNTLSHVLLETVILCSAVATNPSVSKTQAQLAGEKLDKVIGELGSHYGIGKYFVLWDADAPLPEGEEDMREIKNVRLFERIIPQATTHLMAGYKTTSPAEYVIN